MSQTSPLVTVRMLPKRIAKRSALKPRARLMSTTASAKPPERNTARAASPWSAPRARSRSMPTAPARATTSAPSTGETPSTRPSATPARATWARVSAISESRRGIRKTPMAGQMSAVTTPAAKARCMKPYWRNSGMGSVVVADHAHRGAVERGQRRVAQEVARPAVEDQPAVETGELGDLLGHHPDVVAHQDQGHVALAIEMVEQGVEARLGLGVHPAGRLVQDQQLGLGDQRPRDQHPLLLAGRQRADARGRVRGHPHLAEHLRDALAFRAADAPEEAERGQEPGRHHLVDGHRQGGIEGGLLRHVAETAPLPERRRRVTEEADRAALGRQEAQYDAEQGGLAGAIRADDAEEVAGLDGQVDALEHRDRPVGEAHVLELDEGAHQPPISIAPFIARGRADCAVSGCRASHHAPAAAHPAPSSTPPSTSVGQWAFRMTRAKPTAATRAIISAVRTARAAGDTRSRVMT